MSRRAYVLTALDCHCDRRDWVLEPATRAAARQRRRRRARRGRSPPGAHVDLRAGEGDAPNVGQNRMPDSELPNWKVTSYTRTTDLATDRTDMTQTREAQFQFAGALVQRQHQAQDGDVAVNYPPEGPPVRGTEAQARDRRREALHHPVAAVRAALAGSSQVSNFRADGDNDVVDVRTSHGDVIQLVGLTRHQAAVRVAMLDAHPDLGDVVVATAFSDYQEVTGVKMPKRLTTTIDKYPQFDLRVSKNGVDVNLAALGAPDAVKSSPAAQVPPQVVTVDPVARGHLVAGGVGQPPQHRVRVCRSPGAVRGALERDPLEGGHRPGPHAQFETADARRRQPPSLRSFGRLAGGRGRRADDHHPQGQRGVFQGPGGTAVDGAAGRAGQGARSRSRCSSWTTR